MQRRLLNKSALARMLGISTVTLAEMKSRYGGAFPTVKHGARGIEYSFCPRDVSDFLMSVGDHRGEVLAAKLPPVMVRPGEIVLRVGLKSAATDLGLWEDRFHELQAALDDDIDRFFLSEEVLQAVAELADDGDAKMRNTVRETLEKAGASASTVKAVDTRLRRARKAFERAVSEYFTPTSRPAPEVAEGGSPAKGKRRHGT